MTEPLIVARAQGVQLAQALNNALAHCPANSKVPVIRLSMGALKLVATGTDNYTIGKDESPLEDYTGPVTGWSFLAPRKDVEALERAARLDLKGKAIGGLRYYEDDGLIYTPEDQEAQPVAVRDASPDYDALWVTFKAADEILGDVEPEDVKTAFQPQLLQRFAKVKADKTERVADLAIADPEAAVLVKIGPTFKGAIMPVKRERHVKGIGDSEGLW